MKNLMFLLGFAGLIVGWGLFGASQAKRIDYDCEVRVESLCFMWEKSAVGKAKDVVRDVVDKACAEPGEDGERYPVFRIPGGIQQDQMESEKPDTVLHLPAPGQKKLKPDRPIVSHNSVMSAVRTCPVPSSLGQPAIPPNGPSGSLDNSLEGRLVSRASTGDASAFRILFERHAGAVRRFLRDLLGDAAAADEATQETFVRAHSRLSSLRQVDRLLPWLLGIARNVFLEQVRSRRRLLPMRDTEGDEQVDEAPTPEGVLLGREADEVLQQALSRLPHQRSTVLVLRLDDGMGYEDIAQVMGWSLAKVKKRDPPRAAAAPRASDELCRRHSMSAPCSTERLEGLVRQELLPEQVAEVTAHVA